MFYRVLKDGFKNPTNNKVHKKGQVIDLFHTIGNPLTEGKKPALAKSKRWMNRRQLRLKQKLKKNYKSFYQ